MKLVILLWLFQVPGLDTLSLKSLFHEPYIAGVRPQFERFTQDNRAIQFAWNDSALIGTKHYQVNLDGSGLRELAERPEPGTVSPDGRRAVFNERGTLMIGNADGSGKRVLFSADRPAFSPVWSADGTHIAFLHEGDVWTVDVAATSVRRITRKKPEEPAFQIRSWADGNRKLVLTAFDGSEQRDIYFPEYAGKFVTPGNVRRGFGTTTVYLADVETRALRRLLEGQISLRATPVSASGRFVGIDHTDVWQKRREIGVFDLADGAYTAVFTDSTEGWIFSGFQDLRFLPASDRLTFTSEQSGFNHLYTVNPDGSGLTQHTSGDWEVTWSHWLDAGTVLYASTQVDPGERHVYRMDIGRKTVRQLTSETAFRQNFTVSDDGRYLVYGKSYFNTPTDLFLMDLRRPEREVRLTNTIPARFRQVKWLQPEYVRFTGRDGVTKLSMEVIHPPVLEPGKKYPVVVFVHGAGSLQNVYKGWSQNYWREYLFHQWLAMRGYVVIEVDFRHSLFYGRKFREDVTGWMGKYELEDIIDGIDEVAKRGTIDVNRVGVYGGSYGGFMALYALHHAPDRFHAGAALRAVTNWENYYYANPGYTGPRLGHPDRDRENYLRSSPLTFADSLSRPVLILHGLIDDNVGFQDAMQYVERLIQSGNENFDLMVYPTERHSFVRPAAWYDEYRRIYELWERELR